MKESATNGQKEFHGCMGTFLHLFHFNQAFTPGKMLPSQNSSHEVEDPVEKPTEAIKCSGDNAEKKRMPNVVARLMGLEAMPNHDSNSARMQSVGVCMSEKYPLMLSKSRSVNTLSETSLHVVDQNKLQFRSRSFREHHPQEKQLQEFKKDFEASQERRNLVQRSHDRSVSFDSQRIPKKEQKQQSKEFLDALEYLQNNEKIFLRALHDPNSMVSMQIHRPKVSSMTSPLHPIPSSNSVNPSLAKIVMKPGNAKQTNQELRGCRGEAKQSSNRASTELRNGRVIVAKRVKKTEEKCTSKVYKEMDFSHSTSPRRTASIATMSEKGEGPLPNTSKVSSRPRVRKDMTQFSKEGSMNAPFKEQFQSPRGSDKKKPLLKSCSVRRHNVDVHDRIAISLTTSHSSNGKCIAGSPKKRSHLENSMSKGKLQNKNSKESAFTLTNKKEMRTHLTEECQNAQVVPDNHIHINSEQEIESSLEDYHVGNRVDVACNEAVVGIGANSEFPSPVSVLDGPFQHESPIPSPVNMKEVATDFHEVRTKLCSIKLNRDNSVNPDQYGQIHPEEHTLELDTDDRLLATQKESILEKIESYTLESLKLDDIFIPQGKEANFFYVGTVLAFVGFTDNNILAFTRWYSPSHPIDPQVFYQLEECYHNFKTYPHMNFTSRSQYEKSKDEINRQLLFELVDEILCKNLKPFLNTRAWINQSKQNLRYMSTGKELFKEVWDEICKCPEVDCEILDDVEFLVRRDMASEVPWAGDDEDIEKVGFEVEQHIFDDLLVEAIFDLISV